MFEIEDRLREKGITIDQIVSSAMVLYVPSRSRGCRCGTSP